MLDEKGKVTGSLNKVFKYIEFSSNEEEQSGYFFSFFIEGSGKLMTFKKNDSTVKENIPFEKDNVFRISSNSDTFEVIIDNKSIVKFDFTEVELKPHEHNYPDYDYSHSHLEVANNIAGTNYYWTKDHESNLHKGICSICGEEVTIDGTCIEGIPETKFLNTKDVCYRVLSHCKRCGEVISQGPDMPHVLYRDWDTNSRKCSNSGCEYEEQL